MAVIDRFISWVAVSPIKFVWVLTAIALMLTGLNSCGGDKHVEKHGDGHAKAAVSSVADGAKSTVRTSAKAVAGAGSGAKFVAGESDGGNPEGELSSIPRDQLLKMAREMFWHDKHEESARIYQHLIQREPNVLDYKAELGNVYWHQNRQPEAAAIYADIAIPMIEKGQSQQVRSMLGFINAFYPEKAAAIQQRLQSQ